MKISRHSNNGVNQAEPAAAKANKRGGLKVIPANSDSVAPSGGRARVTLESVKPSPMELEISTTFGKSLSELADVLDEPTKK